MRVAAPVERVVVDDGERLAPPPEVDGQVGGQNGVLQHKYHTFELILGGKEEDKDDVKFNLYCEYE